MTTESAQPVDPINVEIRFCVPDDQEKHLPGRRRHPDVLPPNVPIPRQGELIYLSSSSAWGVRLVIHEWRSVNDLRVELWLEYVGSSRYSRPAGFTITQ